MSKITFDKYGRQLTFVDENGTLYMQALDKDHQIQEAYIKLLNVIDAKLDKLLEVPK